MPHSLLSDTTTEGIRVRAIATYLADQSQPSENKFVFAYRVFISNEGTKPARLISRHWVIINGNGDREDVEGPGVVGKYPRLAPGDVFEYTSFCPLDTEWGTMEGTYRMQSEDGSEFDVVIGRFYLACNAPRMEEVI
ncbi:Co2+/Mg2+ efflux protein ApaG [Sphingobacteriales bacterium CHB3]|nr:Co2+/Mg2+ efflux protein ApaG [Sphingobacteriales bacterium CHB3]